MFRDPANIRKLREIDPLDKEMLAALPDGESIYFARIVEKFPTISRETLKDRYKQLARRGLLKYEKGGVNGTQKIELTKLPAEE
jgi:DNA-binding Lrp family transcriptional regulator